MWVWITEPRDHSLGNDVGRTFLAAQDRDY